MNLEDQVCCLELSQNLKELGIKQKSQFYYIKPLIIDEEIIENPYYMIAYISQIGKIYNNMISAFTVGELLKLLPLINVSQIKLLKCSKVEGIYYTCMSPSVDFNFSDNNPSNAGAKMLIYLIENGLVKVEDINNA